MSIDLNLPFGRTKWEVRIGLLVTTETLYSEIWCCIFWYVAIKTSENPLAFLFWPAGSTQKNWNLYTKVHGVTVRMTIGALSCNVLDTFIYRSSILFRLFLFFKIVTTVLRKIWGVSRYSARLSFVFVLLWRPLVIPFVTHHAIRQSL